ncbi:unnamed protein product [Mytilus coruscus]|uniref:Uncharacterized protein n=1 Tax=Mytilus coruscus TaxID=42192 RepID=A0A6J8AXX8_MYTCO|nr:unnamed protein product [Mytilus coruscus]
MLQKIHQGIEIRKEYVNSNQDDDVTAAAKFVKSESKTLCKRHSGSVLQNKDHQSFMTFTELEIRAPNVLKVVSAIGIQRLSKTGLCVSPGSVHNKLISWKDNLDEEIVKLKEGWARGENVKFQLVGDNWDKNILPAFRTSQQKTHSLHLFNVVAVVDWVIPTQT